MISVFLLLLFSVYCFKCDIHFEAKVVEAFTHNVVESRTLSRSIQFDRTHIRSTLGYYNYLSKAVQKR